MPAGVCVCISVYQGTAIKSKSPPFPSEKRSWGLGGDEDGRGVVCKS